MKRLQSAAPKPRTLEELARSYKLPKLREPAKVVASKASLAPIKKAVRARKPRPPVQKQEIIIKVETPKAVTPKKPRRKKVAPKPKIEAPKTEGAAKASEKKGKRERIIEVADTVSAGETIGGAAAGLFGFLRKRKGGLKRLGIAGAEGAVAGGAGTAVYKLSGEEKKKKRHKKKNS